MRARCVDPARRCLRREEWPEIDRLLWDRAFAPSRAFDAQPPRLAAASVVKFAEGYGRWLGFLVHCDALDPLASPADRVTRERADVYLAHLRSLGNSDYTMIGRFAELRRAMELIALDHDWTWLTAPDGTLLRALFGMRKRTFDVPPARVLFAWGVRMMATALPLMGDDRRCVMLRDGLIIAIFASRGIRLRSMASLELGRNVIREGEHWRLMLAEEDVKTRRPIEFGLPAALSPWMERYLTRERTELLQGRACAALWVNWSGEPLGYRGIDKRIRWWSAKRFGKAFGPHRFRHALGSSATTEDPAVPGLGAAVLGITGAVYQEHYNRAKNTAAAARVHDVVRREREWARTAGVETEKPTSRA